MEQDGAANAIALLLYYSDKTSSRGNKKACRAAALRGISERGFVTRASGTFRRLFFFVYYVMVRSGISFL